MPKEKDAWTPYGLESIRIAHLRRRRLLGLLLALLLLGILFSMFNISTSRNQQIFANGNQVGGNGISISQQDTSGSKKDHVTVGIEPGKVTRADTSNTVGGSTIQRASLPTFDRAPPLNWSSYLLLYGPYALLGLAVLYFAKKRGKHDEVNFGVYKGTMPLEMITSSHQGEVFTKKWVKSSIFGKRRQDHLGREIATVELMSVEEDG